MVVFPSLQALQVARQGRPDPPGVEGAPAGADVLVGPQQPGAAVAGIVPLRDQSLAVLRDPGAGGPPGTGRNHERLDRRAPNGKTWCAVRS
jgi:hypothetical protein